MSSHQCSMSTHNGTDYSEFYQVSRFVTGLILYPIICIYGLVGNTLILAVLSRKSMQTSTNVYLSALAVSDTLKLVNDLLYSLTVLLTRVAHEHGQRMFRLLYPNSHFVSNMSASVSSWLTVSVAVERFLLVCHPTRSVTMVTRSRAVCITVACYIVMTAVAVPSAFRYQVNLNDTDNGSGISLTRFWCENKQFVRFYTMLQNMLRSSVPLVILVFMNAFIINALRKTRANKKMASRNRITVLLCIVIVVFLICVTPDALMSGVFGLGYVDANNLVRGVREFTDLLLVVNSAVNFTLYAAFNKAFRDQLRALFAGVESARPARIGGGRCSSVGGGANTRATPNIGYRQIDKKGGTGKLANGKSSMRFTDESRCSRDMGSESSSNAAILNNSCVKETHDL